MITLAKSFEWSGYLQDLMNNAVRVLTTKEMITEIKEEHLLSKSYSEATDEINIKDKPYVFEKNNGEVFTVNNILAFYLDLESELVKLTKAINKAKCSGDIDFDGLVTINKSKRTTLNTLTKMSNTKSSERKIVGYGTKFNEEGNQVKFAYDIKEIATIDFDRNKIKHLLSKYRKETDEVSEKIDSLKLSIMVDYSPTYELKESFEEALCRYWEKNY